MTPDALLAELRAAGITIAPTRDGRLRVTGADDGRLSPHLEAQIGVHRAALLARLSPPPPARGLLSRILEGTSRDLIDAIRGRG